ncbi:MAG: helix-turn-helix transcriptional regulator [Leptospiraceae bacterium]|nr:helix-turn-helix transcriptional regulator [Leptospiraceae bacterium]
MNSTVRLLTTASLGSIAILAAIDIYFDQGHLLGWHILLELAGLLCILIVLSALWWHWYKAVRHSQKNLKTTRSNLKQVQKELYQFRRRHADTLDAMQQAMTDQFKDWQLSPTEIRVAEGLLRGYSIKMIAANLGRKEKTIRNQAAAVYAKSGMVGRADLAAFFLNEILGAEEDYMDSFAP